MTTTNALRLQHCVLHHGRSWYNDDKVKGYKLLQGR